MKVQYKDKIYEIEEKISIEKLLKEEIKKSKYPVVGAKFNNKYMNLSYKITNDSVIELLDTSTKEGAKIYKRTLIYIIAKAFEKLFPDKKMVVSYQLGHSMYCEIEDFNITEEQIEMINAEMRRIVKANLPIKQVVMTREEAEEFYSKNNTPKGRLQMDIEGSNKIYMYYCEDYYNYCYGTMGNRTGITKIFEILKYENGFLIRYPSPEKPDQLQKLIQAKKLKWALSEYEDIHKILNMETTYRLNSAVEDGKIEEVIMIDEALHEKKIANIADRVAKNRELKMILIAGPSSSGKTTFAQRLGIQLRINKIKPVTISVDNYFVDRKYTPKDKDGNYEYENIEAIDLKLFNDHLTKLLNGETVEMPEFDFIEGKKEYHGHMLKLEKDEVLVIEGIHCLNDKLTSSIEKEHKYKIYISALTVLNMDRYNRISSTDTRLIRRIVRDHQFRGYNAKYTISTWHKVNEGEQKNIFPFQEEADSIFNTSLIYELGVLKGVAMPLLEEIKRDEPEYAEARRLIYMLKYFKTIPAECVPTNSLLKEFTGGGHFDKH